MPFELGLDLGCKRYRTSDQKDKLLLILDTERDRYRQFISDIAGQDIANHNGNVRIAISIVRDWLRPHLQPLAVKTQSGATIFRRYKEFQTELSSYCDNLNGMLIIYRLLTFRGRLTIGLKTIRYINRALTLAITS